MRPGPGKIYLAFTLSTSVLRMLKIGFAEIEPSKIMSIYCENFSFD